MESVDALVIGAGVVGLAVARELALRGREVLVLDAAGGIGTGASSRNSEVIHAGIYYPAGSLKARHCVAGRQLLYAYCAERTIAHRRCGKLIVATSQAQLPRLQALQASAACNGVTDLQWLSAAQAQAMEPELACVAALHSPSTGIVDSHALMLSLLGDLESMGGLCVLRTPLEHAHITPQGIELQCGGESPMRLQARSLVNCAGLDAPAVAQRMAGFPADRIPTPRYARGCYFSLAGRSPFDRLVYPIPEEAGLGVHLTIDLASQARFGPDVEWIDSPSYEVDPRRADAFYAEIRRYWPALPDGALQPAYAGVRPKINGPGEPARDFWIEGPDAHGVPGIVQLFGIESPGLTACLSIAQHVAGLLGHRRALP